MYRSTTQGAPVDKSAHFHHFRRELAVVPDGYESTASVRMIQQRFRIVRCYRKGFFNVDMTTCIKASRRQIEMALRRCRNVHNVWDCLPKHGGQVGKAAFDAKALRQLLSHSNLTVTSGNDPGIRDALDCLNVLVSDLATADNCYSQHHSSDLGNCSRKRAMASLIGMRGLQPKRVRSFSFEKRLPFQSAAQRLRLKTGGSCPPLLRE
jgi:hypothetical protein